jgi:hypothetical protein
MTYVYHVTLNRQPKVSNDSLLCVRAAQLCFAHFFSTLYNSKHKKSNLITHADTEHELKIVPLDPIPVQCTLNFSHVKTVEGILYLPNLFDAYKAC